MPNTCPQHRPPDGCTIVARLAELDESHHVTPEACAACLRHAIPQAPNAVTASLALFQHADNTARTAELLRTLHPLLRREHRIPETDSGPGTELKRYLGRIGIHADPNCQCNARAAEMDRNGPEWCRANLETIVDWLAEESARRQLPFVRLAGRALVRLAIRAAEKRARRAPPPQPGAEPTSPDPDTAPA